MYDMYAWDQPASSADEHVEAAVPPGPGRAAGGARAGYASRADRPDDASRNGHVAGGAWASAGASRASTGASRAVQAVQVALDRRDNGGDAGSSRRV